jgi:hypothetical protein
LSSAPSEASTHGTSVVKEINDDPDAKYALGR